MKNEYEIIGRAIECLFHAEKYEYIDKEILREQLLKEYLTAMNSDMDEAQKSSYLNALNMFAKQSKE